MIRIGKFAAEKIKYKDGIGCCLWEITQPEYPDVGICFDFAYNDIDKIIEILQVLKNTKVEEFKDVKESL